MPTAHLRSLALLVAAPLVFVPAAVHAQSYFTPLVTPPSSVGTCMPVRKAARDSTMTEHRLVIMSTPPGSSRYILLATGRSGAFAYSDMTHSTLSLTTARGGDVVAFRDSIGHMRGWRHRSATVLPESAVRPDTASLHHLREQIAAHSRATRTPLSAAEQTRVREMAEWMLRRCPG